MRLLTDLAVVLRLVLYPPQALHSHRDCQVAMVGRLLDIFRHGKWTALTRQCSRAWISLTMVHHSWQRPLVALSSFSVSFALLTRVRPAELILC